MNTASSPQSWLGQRLGDQQRYRLMQQLGGGGIGDVYLAVDTRLGRHVAIKLLKGTLAKSKEVLSRFEREVVLSAALESEHIVEVLDYGVAAGDHPFYVMEYLQGQPLSQLIGRSTRLSPELATQIAIQICAGLKVAHEGVVLWREGAENTEKIKVIHRDLKPANIFLVQTAIGPLVKVLDFGIAKKLHLAEQSNQTNLTQAFLGTFRYASPEQLINARNLDERADLYSLGMILYEMLSGTDPFGVCATPAQQREVAWAMAHDAGQPVPLRQRPECAHVPVELEEIVMRCLKRRVGDRFGSAVELMQALHAVPFAVRKETPTSPPRSPVGLDPTVAKPLMPIPDPTVSKPLVPEASTPDETIAQIAANPPQRQPITASHPSAKADSPPYPDPPAIADGTIAQVFPPPAKDETVAQAPVLKVEPAPIASQFPDRIAQPAANRDQRDETIAQPAANHQRDETVAQTLPSVSHQDNTISHQGNTVSHQDNTIAQVSPPRRRDETIVQSPHRRRDETIAQVSPPLAQKRDETIAQVPDLARGDETQAQIPVWNSPARTDETVAQIPNAPRIGFPLPTAMTPSMSAIEAGANRQLQAVLRQPLRGSLLLLGAGFLLGLLMMAGLYVFLRSSQSQSPQSQQSSAAASILG